jgi:hypothetical protein
MTKSCTFFLAMVGLVSASIAGAQERPPPMPAPAAGSLPAHEIRTIVRSTGFQPTGRPVLRGRHYDVPAIDPYQLAVRLVVDARTGQIIAVRHDVRSGPPDAPLSGEAYAQASPYRPVPPWRMRAWSEGRPVPPRAIPSGAAALAAQKAPLPRPRPDDQTGSIGGTTPSAGAPARAAAPPSPAASGGGVSVPVAPLE